jgi:predicted PurR-regulated permease PerM
MRRLIDTILAAAVGAVASTAMAWFLRHDLLRHVAGEMTYQDLAATLLAVVSAMVAIIGIFIAILAIISYTQFKTMVTNAATGHINVELPIHLTKLLPPAMEKHFQSASFVLLVKNRVDSIIYNSEEMTNSPDEMED